MSDDDLIIDVPPPEACRFCETTDADTLAWPEPWVNPVVMTDNATGQRVRICWACAPNRLTPLSVDYGEPEGEAIKVEAELTFDADDPMSKLLLEWRQSVHNPFVAAEKPIEGWKGGTFFGADIPMIAGPLVNVEDLEDEGGEEE